MIKDGELAEPLCWNLLQRTTRKYFHYSTAKSGTATMIILKISLIIQRHYKEILIGVVCFTLGSGLMYHYERNHLKELVISNKEKLHIQRKLYNHTLNTYQQSLETSNELLNNCYDAFYTVSKCSTKEGCDFVYTVSSLTKLEVQRKILEFNLDRLLDETDSLWLKNGAETLTPTTQ